MVENPNCQEAEDFVITSVVARFELGSTKNNSCQETIKVREWIPHIGPLAKVIHLKLFLDIVLSRILLARCVDVFVEDQFMCRFVLF